MKLVSTILIVSDRFFKFSILSGIFLFAHITLASGAVGGSLINSAKQVANDNRKSIDTEEKSPIDENGNINDSEGYQLEQMNKVRNIMMKERKMKGGNMQPEKLNLGGSDNIIEEEGEEDYQDEDSGNPKSSGTTSLKMSTGNKADNVSKGVLDMAYKAFNAGNFESAIYYYKKALAKEKNSKNALFGLATSYQYLGEKRNASESYIKILELDPNNDDALNNVMVLNASESNERVVSYFLKLEKISPNNPVILAQLGTLYMNMNQLDKSIDYLERAVSFSPDDVFYIYNLAIAYDKANDVKNSIAHYKATLEFLESTPNEQINASSIKNRIEYLYKRSLE